MKGPAEEDGEEEEDVSSRGVEVGESEADEVDNDTHASEHDEEDRVVESERTGDDEFVEESREKECSESSNSAIAGSEEDHFSIHVVVEPVMDDDIPLSVVFGVAAQQPPLVVESPVSESQHFSPQIGPAVEDAVPDAEECEDTHHAC